MSPDRHPLGQTRHGVVVSEVRIRKRARLKTKETRKLREDFAAVFGDLPLWNDDAAVEVGSLPDYDVVLVNGQIHGLIIGEAPFLSVRGMLAYRPTARWVTVDMGAVRFVHNGADIMAPGITDADPELQPGDLCWVRDERNQQPLAVGRCVVSGADMKAGTKGKAVASVHHIGDKVWELDG